MQRRQEWAGWKIKETELIGRLDIHQRFSPIYIPSIAAKGTVYPTPMHRSKIYIPGSNHNDAIDFLSHHLPLSLLNVVRFPWSIYFQLLFLKLNEIRRRRRRRGMGCVPSGCPACQDMGQLHRRRQADEPLYYNPRPFDCGGVFFSYD